MTKALGTSVFASAALRHKVHMWRYPDSFELAPPWGAKVMCLVPAEAAELADLLRHYVSASIAAADSPVWFVPPEPVEPPEQWRLGEFLVVFEDSDPDERWRPWRLVTKRGFRHCWAAYNDGPGWLRINPTANGIMVERSLLSTSELMEFHGQQAETRVLYLCSRRPRRFLGRGLLTCVSVVKQILGVRAAWAITPYGLYRHLLKRNHAAQYDGRGSTHENTESAEADCRRTVLSI